MFKSSSPITFTKNRLHYVATASNGRELVLQNKDSSVSLKVPKYVKSPMVQCVHTDFRPFESAIPRAECFISPVVEIHCNHLRSMRTDKNQMYCLEIPHCRDMSLDNIKVRIGDIHTNRTFVEVPHGQLQEEEVRSIFYEVDGTYIRVYSTHFCQIICSSCHQTCSSFILALPFGSLNYIDEETLVKVKVYLCSALYKIEDFAAVSNSGFPYI